MTRKISKEKMGFVASSFPDPLIFLQECGKMRDLGNEVGFIGFGELNTMFYIMP